MDDDQVAGFKKLSVENWRQADPANGNFVRRSELTGEILAMEEDDWARQFLAVELKGHVPVEIRDLFAIARGAMIYGWFFYPLFRLGEEQLYRLTETALRRCYGNLGGPKRQPTFTQAVDFLVGRRVIPSDDRERWEAARKLRNAVSHPERASVMPPGAVLGMLKVNAHDINRLFARCPVEAEEKSLADRD